MFLYKSKPTVLLIKVLAIYAKTIIDSICTNFDSIFFIYNQQFNKAELEMRVLRTIINTLTFFT